MKLPVIATILSFIFANCHSDKHQQVVVSKTNSTLTPPKPEPSSQAAETIRKLKIRLHLADTVTKAGEEEIMVCYGGGFSEFYANRCMLRQGKWQGKFYRFHGDEKGNWAVDSCQWTPRSGWLSFVQKMEKHQWRDLPTEAAYQQEIRKPDRKGRYFKAMDGSDLNLEIRNGSDTQFRYYNNVISYAQSIDSDLLARLDTFQKDLMYELYPDFIP